MTTTIGIQSISYVLPKKIKTLPALEKEGRLSSGATRLSALGFEKVHIGTDHMELATAALKSLLAKNSIDPQSIDLFIYAGALPNSHLAVENNNQGLTFFKYAASKLQYDFDLSKAVTFSISQQGCVSLMNAVWIAINTLKSESYKTALCLSADVLPTIAKREIIYNAMSDASCAVLLKKNALRNTIITYHQISKGYYWNPEKKENEIIASYFPTAKLAVEQTLAKAGLQKIDIDWIIPHNVSKKSWEILVGLLQLPKARLYEKNMKRVGHTIAADNFMNLQDALDEGIIKKNQYMLLFTFGFGAHWSCMIVKH